MTVRPGWGDRRTCIRFTDGDDFTSFGDPEMLFQPDALDTDHVKGFYGMPVFPCGEGYVGLLWTFHNSSSRPVNSFNQFFGVMDAELTTSYDGVRWNRTRLGTFLKRNPMGEHGCMQLRPSCLVEADNEIRIYAEASKAAHGLERSLGKQLEEPTKSIELFTLRRDGYLYLRSQGDWARFQTKPIALWTPEITMNADARYGEIRFQLTDEKSQPIEGFTFDDCVPFRRKQRIRPAAAVEKREARCGDRQGHSVRDRTAQRRVVLVHRRASFSRCARQVAPARRQRNRHAALRLLIRSVSRRDSRSPRSATPSQTPRRL